VANPNIRVRVTNPVEVNLWLDAVAGGDQKVHITYELGYVNLTGWYTCVCSTQHGYKFVKDDTPPLTIPMSDVKYLRFDASPYYTPSNYHLHLD